MQNNFDSLKTETTRTTTRAHVRSIRNAFLVVASSLQLFLPAVPTLAATSAIEQIIDREKTLFGIEYTSQDQAMVDEPGRNTIFTDYKDAKAKQFAEVLAAKFGLNPVTAVTQKLTWKDGWYLNIPGDGQWVLNSEPVTVEINSTPRLLKNIKTTAQPIFEAMQAVGLKPYIRPAAERSGMGHIHVGGQTLAESPFAIHPHLLRNVMVYMHKNPALMYGFSEAYDLGVNSNIESYHLPERQQQFQLAVLAYDEWAKQQTFDFQDARSTVRGLQKFIELVKHYGAKTDFCEHFRFINLEHLCESPLNRNPYSLRGKYTVEFRNFRPPKDAETTEAFAELLLAVMDHSAKKDYLEPFQTVREIEYANYFSGTTVDSNWLKTSRELGLSSNMYLNAAIREYVDNIHSEKFPVAFDLERSDLSEAPVVEVFRAYSEKEFKGTRFEIRINASQLSVEAGAGQKNGTTYALISTAGAIDTASAKTFKVELMPLQLRDQLVFSGILDTRNTPDLTADEVLSGKLTIAVKGLTSKSKLEYLGSDKSRPAISGGKVDSSSSRTTRPLQCLDIAG